MIEREHGRVPWRVAAGWLGLVGAGILIWLVMITWFPNQDGMLVRAAVSYMVFMVFAAAFLVRAELRHNKRFRLIDAGFCPDCGYDLRATPGRCTECGWRREVS